MSTNSKMRRKDREITEPEEIYKIIEKAEVCRIALTDGEWPYIVALNFGFEKENGGRLYFHSALQGKKLEIIAENNKVCFQMDIEHQLITAEKACDYTSTFKSVVGFGRIKQAGTEQEKIKGLDVIMSHYAGDEKFSYPQNMLRHTAVLVLEIESMTAKEKK